MIDDVLGWAPDTEIFHYARCAGRNWFRPEFRYDRFGFRVVASPF